MDRVPNSLAARLFAARKAANPALNRTSRKRAAG